MYKQYPTAYRPTNDDEKGLSRDSENEEPEDAGEEEEGAEDEDEDEEENEEPDEANEGAMVRVTVFIFLYGFTRKTIQGLLGNTRTLFLILQI